jgi:transposase-like protein
MWQRDTLEKGGPAEHIRTMRKSDIICPKCNAGYRRIELPTRKGGKGEYRCLLCNHVLEVFDGSTEIAIRLTVHPEKTFQ